MSRKGSSSGWSDRRPTTTKVRLRQSTDRRRLVRPELGPVHARPLLLPRTRRCPCRASSMSGTTWADPSGCRQKEGRTGPACASVPGDLRTKPDNGKMDVI